jgi:hypothetical protein
MYLLSISALSRWCRQHCAMPSRTMRCKMFVCAIMPRTMPLSTRDSAQLWLGHVPSASFPRVLSLFFPSIPLPPPMPDPKSNIRDSEPGIDEEQGQGTDLSFIHNRLVLTPFCRGPRLPTPHDTFPARSRPSGRVELLRWF